MAKNQIDFDDALFNRPQISSDDSGGILPPDPTLPTRVRVTLDNLEPYAGNPRRALNPEYDAIKESIRNRGLDHAPNVTRQRPDQPYMIKDGGNTRLQILKELWQETQNPKFFEIDCMFHPWVSERDVLLAHIIENEMRGHMSFIDRANAAMRLKVDLEAEQSVELSNRELSRQITSLGWSLDQSVLATMIYAHQALSNWLPNSFEDGLGRPSVKAIRKMLDECRTYWDSVATPEEGEFDAIWQPIFKDLDDYNAFDLDLARSRVEEAIAKALDCPVGAIRGEIQGVAKGFLEPGHRPVNAFENDEPAPAPKYQSPPPKVDAQRAPDAGRAAPEPSLGGDNHEAEESAHHGHEHHYDEAHDYDDSQTGYSGMEPGYSGSPMPSEEPPVQQAPTDQEMWTQENPWRNTLFSFGAPETLSSPVTPPRFSSEAIQDMRGYVLESAFRYAEPFRLTHVFSLSTQDDIPYFVDHRYLEQAFYSEKLFDFTEPTRTLLYDAVDCGIAYGVLVGNPNFYRNPPYSRVIEMRNNIPTGELPNPNIMTMINAIEEIDPCFALTLNMNPGPGTFWNEMFDRQKAFRKAVGKLAYMVAHRA